MKAVNRRNCSSRELDAVNGAENSRVFDLGGECVSRCGATVNSREPERGGGTCGSMNAHFTTILCSLWEAGVLRS